MDRKNSKIFPRSAKIFAVLLAGIFLIQAARAQQEETQPAVQGRLLLIFDTSAGMKKYVPAVQKALVSLFVTGLNGQLNPGDTIGAWTFDKDLRTDQFPMRYWTPSGAATFTADISSFVQKQRYSKTTGFGALQPYLDNVAKDSERLTVMIFCNGETPVGGTPYDDGINQILQQRQAAQIAAKQPIVIVMRVQFGKYVGCTVNFPPSLVSLPDFPPLTPPAPPEPANEPAPPPPPKPVVMHSIIMINTNPPPAPKLEVTNPPAPAATANPVAQTNVAPEIITITNTVTLPAENSGIGSDDAMAVGAGLLAVAVGLTFFMLRSSRRKNQTSLISRSMRRK